MTVLAFKPRPIEVDGPVSDHWLIFNAAREVVGCHCGFDADESDLGWGDSVVDHLLEQGTP
jgi:hypothetical protein